MTTNKENKENSIFSSDSAAQSANGLADVASRASKVTPIGINAQRVMNARYASKNEAGEPLEDWSQIVERVVGAVALAETHEEKRNEFAVKMKKFMNAREFIPNTPCLVNAGKPGGQLAACFVLPIEDSIDDIMKHAQAVAKIHQTGGGTGQSYELIRPAGAVVNSTKGVASGPVSFMRIVNTATDVVKQGGVRRGANMGILRITHPDILRFIHAKNDQDSLTNFNISATVTDKFMEAVEYREWFQLEFDGEPWSRSIFDPVTGEDYALYFLQSTIDAAGHAGRSVPDDCDPETFADVAAFQKWKADNHIGECPGDTMVKIAPPQPGMVFAPDIWNRIIASAHKYAEPGIIFIDEVNRHNYLKETMGEIHSCNPCAEQMLHANNSCNLGSIDVSKFFDENSTKHYKLDWDKLGVVIAWSVRFLDNVIDVCEWPLPEVEEVVKRTRPVGLGIMGFADLCLKLKIRYGSEESLKLMDCLMRYFRREAWNSSLVLGHEKGAFPEFKGNFDAYKKFFASDEMKPFSYNFPLLPRNYEVTTVAPTGTISLIAETSSGIEPNFSWAYVRQDTVGTRTAVNPLAAEALGLKVDYSDEDSIKQAAEFVVANVHLLPDYFVTAMDLTAEEHVRILAAAQRHVDNAISKTCNGKAGDTIESVDKLYRLARELGCKAVSYYRDGSREDQVLTAMVKPSEQAKAEPEKEIDSNVRQNAAPTKHGRIERPRELQGSTWSFDFAENNLYVTVNHNSQTVLEVFVAGSISNGVGVLASTMLQSDCFTAEDVARKLNKITGTHSVWFNQRLLTSPEQAVAECLRIVSRRLADLPDGNHSVKSLEIQTIENAKPQEPAQARSEGYEFKICPKCNEQALVTDNGCPTCTSCFYSKCS